MAIIDQVRSSIAPSPAMRWTSSFRPSAPVAASRAAEFCDRCAQAVRAAPTRDLRTMRPTAAGRRPTMRLPVKVGRLPSPLSRAAALHTAPLREAIHALKYEDRPGWPLPLGRYLVAAFAAGAVAFVRGRYRRGCAGAAACGPLRERGYNQSELLAARPVRCVCGLDAATELDRTCASHAAAGRPQRRRAPAERGPCVSCVRRSGGKDAVGGRRRLHDRGDAGSVCGGGPACRRPVRVYALDTCHPCALVGARPGEAQRNLRVEHVRRRIMWMRQGDWRGSAGSFEPYGRKNRS